MEEDSDEEEGPATQPGHAGTAAMPIGYAQMRTLYLASLPSAITLSLSILARLRSTSPNYNQHGGSLKFCFI